MGGRQRGATLIEMMVTLAVTTIVIGGTVMFLAAHSRMSAGTFDRTDIQRSGRGALSVLEETIGKTGLGLPKTLAIKSYVAIDGDATHNPCANSPRLEVAAVDFTQQWEVSDTDGTAASGTINLQAIANGPPANPDPGGVAGDVDFDANQWLFIYTTASQDLLNGFGADRGHGLVMTTGRGAGDLAIPISSSPSGTAYSGAQLTLDLSSTAELNNIAGRGSVLMRAEVSAFGMNCQNAAHPYLYWESNGVQSPVASNVATAGMGLTAGVGLRFRFLLDLTGPDGVPDGVGETWDATPGVLTIDPDPVTGEQDNVTAIEVTLILRSDIPDPQLNDYRTKTFTMLIQTPNIHTRVDPDDASQLGRYFFVENSGI